MHKEVSGKLKTHNVNSEIVYDFSSTNNVSTAIPVQSQSFNFIEIYRTQISQSLRRYGVADDSTALIVIKVGGDPSEVEIERGHLMINGLLLT